MSSIIDFFFDVHSLLFFLSFPFFAPFLLFCCRSFSRKRKKSLRNPKHIRRHSSGTLQNSSPIRICKQFDKCPRLNTITLIFLWLKMFSRSSAFLLRIYFICINTPVNYSNRLHQLHRFIVLHHLHEFQSAIPLIIRINCNV